MNLLKYILEARHETNSQAVKIQINNYTYRYESITIE